MSSIDLGLPMDVMGKLLNWITSVAWPLVAIFLGLWYYGLIREIGLAIVNLSKRAKSGFGMHFDQAQSESSVESGTVQAESAIEDIAGGDRSLQFFIDDMKAALLHKNITLKPTEAEKRLLAAWAFTARERAFDRISRVIYITQVEALRRLAKSPTDGRGLKSIYNRHVELVLGADEIASFGHWMNFLVSNDLAEKMEKAQYEITDLGRAFLIYADATGLPETRHL